MVTGPPDAGALSSARSTWETVGVARSRFRSVRYDLAAAVEVARLADSAGGTIAPDLLAPALGYSGTNNGAYLSRVASARLFGVVAGRGSRLEVTERGRQILAGVEPGATIARREAFLAVPLFRAVADATAAWAGVLPDDLARRLVEEFGELEGKARQVADQLIASAGQARLIRRIGEKNFLLTDVPTSFTSVDNPPSHPEVPPVRLRRGTRSAPGEDIAMAEDGLWLDEVTDTGVRRPPAWRRVGVLASAAAVLVVVAVPVALVAGGSSARPAAVHRPGTHALVGNGPAEHQVLAALSATTDSGSFNFSYDITSTPASPSVPTTTSTTTCHKVQVPVPTGTGPVPAGYAPVQMPASTAVGSPSQTGGVAVSVSGSANPVVVTPGSGSLPPGLKWGTETMCSGGAVAPLDPEVKGSGTINTGPFAMVASANIGSGLAVSVRVSSGVVYESGSTDNGLAPASSNAAASGTALPGFAGLTESTLGSREGAVAMMGMASPTGYLDLVQPAIGAASQTGTGSVDGVPVTNYQVTNDLGQLAGAAGTSSAQAQAINDALGVLKGQGYTANTAVVSIDGAGFIRQVKSTDTFGDGGSVTLSATFSDFGCAGTVLMPGQTGSGVPPAGCTSPDVPGASTTTTTTSAVAAPTTTGSSMTTVPGSPTTTPTSGGSTTTTVTSVATGSSTTLTVPSTTSSS